MTNAEIIAKACHAAGIGEEVHTFAVWKKLGYSVRKGQKSTMTCAIWKHKTRTRINESGEDETVGRMFMTTAHFFGRSQVEPVTQTGR